MCRILYARADDEFDIAALLAPFAVLSENSEEYQGHGWGCAWRDDSGWRIHRQIEPIWESKLDGFGRTRLLLVHARSAFRDEGIVVDNNMPFSDGASVFLFNGELRGVRIRSEGRIGAEKIYNYIRRFDRGDLLAATDKAMDIIEKRSAYLRAANLFLSDGESTVLATRYNENPGYFQMYRKSADGIELVCSRPFAGDAHWIPIENRTTTRL